jgi:hypothetical protein
VDPPSFVETIDDEDSIFTSPLNLAALKLKPSKSTERFVDEKSLDKISKFIGIINLSLAFPPLPPSVIAVPEEAFEELLANLKLFASTFITKYVVPEVKLLRAVPAAL